MRFHYAKTLPTMAGRTAWSVYDGPGDREWCGCIIYSLGVCNGYAECYGMVPGQVMELVRMALNGKQSSTSKAMAISMKLLRKACPTVRMLLSFADTAQGHQGIIYQATNWVCLGATAATESYLLHGKLTHTRTVTAKMRGRIAAGLARDAGLAEVRRLLDPKAERITMPPKIRYGYAIDPSLRAMLEAKRKPIPTIRGRRLGSEAAGHQPDQGGAHPTRPLQLPDETEELL